ncbi:MAG: sugar phosphate isomerase/epimerase family protein, partial [Gemmobacter sp.]
MPTLPRLGAALTLGDMPGLRDWLFETDRAIEIQDFCTPEAMVADQSARIEGWRHALAGHGGARVLHGPFYGLDLANPDDEIRAVVQRRLIRGVEIAAHLGCDVMVVHSPFDQWGRLNYLNYTGYRDALLGFSAMALRPVLRRAADAGVVLVLENIEDCDPADRVDLVRRIDHPSLRVSLDTGHALLTHQRMGAPPVQDHVTVAGDLLAHVHLQDTDGWADRHWHP